MGIKSAEFSYLMEGTQTTKGKLSFQSGTLKEAGDIEIKKSFRGNFPLTTCEITGKGAEAFKKYVASISGYLNNKKIPVTGIFE
jgi:hypothetical protein